MPEFPSGGKSIVELILVSEDRNKSKRAGLWEWQSGIREGTFFYESTWLKSIKNSNYVVARKFGNIFRFTDDLIAINDGNKFGNDYSEICPSEIILKKWYWKPNIQILWQKVVICHPLCHNINMWKLLVILVVKKENTSHTETTFLDLILDLKKVLILIQTIACWEPRASNRILT